MHKANVDQQIINYENKMLKMYSKLIENYSQAFKQYDCLVKVGFWWKNWLNNRASYNRLPFENGYSCYVSCEIQRNGNEVHIESCDGEAEYYSLSATWPVSSIGKRWFKTNVCFYSDIDEVKKSMEWFLELLLKNSLRQ